MEVTYQNTVFNAPDFFVVGAPKCGTTSIYEHLQNDPNVFLSKVKEPQFLAYKNQRNEYKIENSKRKYTGIIFETNDYLGLFDEARPNQLIGDFSTHYLRFSNEFVKNVRDLYGPQKMSKLKIIIILRDPIDRAYSHFLMRKRNGIESLSFLQAMETSIIEERMSNSYLPTYDYIRFSKYYDDIEHLKQVFPNVFVYRFEDLKKNNEMFISKLLSDLHLQNGLVGELKRHNVSGVAKKGLLNHWMFFLVFRRNIFKKIVPVSIKSKLKNVIIDRFGKKVMEATKITEIERDKARVIFKEEYIHLNEFGY